MKSKIKSDYKVNQNIYYRSGIFFMFITLIINLSTRLGIAPLDWKYLRLFSVSVGISFYFYGIYIYYKKTRDLSFLKQTFLVLFIGVFILFIFYLT